MKLSIPRVSSSGKVRGSIFTPLLNASLANQFVSAKSAVGGFSKPVDTWLVTECVQNKKMAWVPTIMPQVPGNIRK